MKILAALEINFRPRMLGVIALATVDGCLVVLVVARRAGGGCVERPAIDVVFELEGTSIGTVRIIRIEIR